MQYYARAISIEVDKFIVLCEVVVGTSWGLGKMRAKGLKRAHERT